MAKSSSTYENVKFDTSKHYDSFHFITSYEIHKSDNKNRAVEPDKQLDNKNDLADAIDYFQYNGIVKKCYIYIMDVSMAFGFILLAPRNSS